MLHKLSISSCVPKLSFKQKEDVFGNSSTTDPEPGGRNFFKTLALFLLKGTLAPFAKGAGSYLEDFATGEGTASASVGLSSWYLRLMLLLQKYLNAFATTSTLSLNCPIPVLHLMQSTPRISFVLWQWSTTGMALPFSVKTIPQIAHRFFCSSKRLLYRHGLIPKRNHRLAWLLQVLQWVLLSCLTISFGSFGFPQTSQFIFLLFSTVF